MVVSDKDKQRFHNDMVDLYKRGKTVGFNATRFLNMISEYGGYETACRLIAGRDDVSGFTELWAVGRLDLSMEHLVVNYWSHIFTDEQVKICADRLAGLKPPPKE